MKFLNLGSRHTGHGLRSVSGVFAARDPVLSTVDLIEQIHMVSTMLATWPVEGAHTLPNLPPRIAHALRLAHKVHCTPLSTVGRIATQRGDRTAIALQQ